MMNCPAGHKMRGGDRSIPIVILAGGEGRRIGGRKPHQMLGGQSLLDRALAYARSLSDKVVVAVKHTEGISGVETIADPPDLAGPLAGLVASLTMVRECSLPRVATIPCDTPFLPSDLLVRLLSINEGAPVAIAESSGTLHPVCGIWSSNVLDALPSYIETGRLSLEGFARHVGSRTYAWDADPDPFFNVNDAEDLIEASRRLDSGANM
jgi:molybdopterin-guanine dinucleotide biosynthesis protein A